MTTMISTGTKPFDQGKHDVSGLVPPLQNLLVVRQSAYQSMVDQNKYFDATNLSICTSGSYWFPRSTPEP